MGGRHFCTHLAPPPLLGCRRLPPCLQRLIVNAKRVKVRVNNRWRYLTYSAAIVDASSILQGKKSARNLADINTADASRYRDPTIAGGAADTQSISSDNSRGVGASIARKLRKEPRGSTIRILSRSCRTELVWKIQMSPDRVNERQNTVLHPAPPSSFRAQFPYLPSTRGLTHLNRTYRRVVPQTCLAQSPCIIPRRR